MTEPARLERCERCERITLWLPSPDGWRCQSCRESSNSTSRSVGALGSDPV